MFAHQDDELLTMAEAARILKVSVVTIKRWLKQGIIPAYRVGPRYVRIRRSDLARATALVGKEETMPAEEKPPAGYEVAFRPLTDEEVKRHLEAMEACKAFQAEMLAERNGVPFSPSWPLIREAREERSRQI
ncbi:MAG: DNA-binding protein [Chloroflexota bacterium]|nr:MAG: DNA-binding protein [Chloroflexota bacterium]